MGSKKQRKLTSTRLRLLWADWVWFEGINSHKKSLWSFGMYTLDFCKLLIVWSVHKGSKFLPTFEEVHLTDSSLHSCVNELHWGEDKTCLLPAQATTTRKNVIPNMFLRPSSASLSTRTWLYWSLRQNGTWMGEHFGKRTCQGMKICSNLCVVLQRESAKQTRLFKDRKPSTAEGPCLFSEA